MKLKTNMKKTARSVISAVTIGLMSLSSSHAHPYASGVVNNAGTIKFILNESADNVGVSFDNNTATNNLGALGQGDQSFSLGSHTNFQIYVTKVGAGVPTIISSDANTNCIWPSPRGLAINTNPKSTRFGRIYVANSSPSGSKQRGLYAYRADLLTDVLGKGTNATGTGAFVADALSPNRLTVAANDDVYVSDCSASGATIFRFSADLTSSNQLLAVRGDAGQPLGYHGRIPSAPAVTGSLATGDLVMWAVDSSLGPQFNSIFRYDINSSTVPWSNAPTFVVNLGLSSFGVISPNNLTQPPTDLDRGPDGHLFASFNRSTGSLVVPGLQVFDSSGSLLWDSQTADGGTPGSGPDFLNITANIPPGLSTGNNGAYIVRLSPDYKYVAVAGVDNHISIFSLLNGVPDASTFYYFTNLPSTANARDMAWDAADNIYLASSGQGLLRVFSLGLSTTAITGNDSTGTNGTYQLITPNTTVTVSAPSPTASPNGPTLGQFTITRSNPNNDYSSPLVVNFTLGGTATNGTYTLSPAGLTPATGNTIVIAAGQTSTNITVTAVNDGLPRPTTTVLLTVKGGTGYTAVNPSQATVSIENIGPQFVFISSVPARTMYKGLTNDFGSFVITRWGDTSVASYVVNTFTNAGTAVSNVDYVAAQAVTFDPGVTSVTNTISPLQNNPAYLGNKTVIVGLANGGGYSAGTNTGTLTIIDNAYPNNTVLYSNPLTDPNDATNWAITAANNNMSNFALDSTVEFGYDLTANNPESGQNGLIPLPPNGATNALRVTVNKNGIVGSANAAAGVNLYLTNKVFSGNYAVRFNMNMTEGGASDYTTEGPLFGINHGGTYTNWWSGSALVSAPPGWTTTNWSSDGIWYWMSSDGGASAGDYLEKTGLGGTNNNTGWQNLASGVRTTFLNIFKNPIPYSTSAPGMPANSSPANGVVLGYTNAWADVEIKQINNIVTMYINKQSMFVYTNGTVWQSGVLMLGYNDPFSSVGAPDGAVYFSNLRVVQLGPPVITSITKTGSNIVIKFASIDGDDTASSFALQSSATLAPAAFADASPAATITELSPGNFQATTTSTSSEIYYRIRHK